ncbi:hypothetical protein EDB81DRAFT_820252 [Dactylonectria macrodidyma]|uniref:Uncharacterized protein n=1 Tax=Dactylonectria macrodidyma TaxID=307937 RepID=A0A9P9DB82_9HYPO|nr:hypothetical protein EDB81DRAFT_820252 [Dactylonectria macrodidyma]
MGPRLTHILALQDGAACKHFELQSTCLDVLSRHLKKSHRCEIKRTGAKGKQWLRSREPEEEVKIILDRDYLLKPCYICS